MSAISNMLDEEEYDRKIKAVANFVGHLDLHFYLAQIESIKDKLGWLERNMIGNRQSFYVLDEIEESFKKICPI